MPEEFPGFRTLIPNRENLDLFSNKSLSYDFMSGINVTELIPRTMGLNFDPPTIPRVIERRDLAVGIGVAFIKDLNRLRVPFDPSISEINHS